MKGQSANIAPSPHRNHPLTEMADVSVRRPSSWHCPERAFAYWRGRSEVVLDLDLPRVESFVVFAGEQHLGRAAARLNLTQPALSKRIVRVNV